jgi:2-amino-4-hydroxy-6-hydroxymethyldihydropteridine diphosphokinase
MLDVAYVALGSNLGDRDVHLSRARAAIGAIPNCQIVGESSIEETAPIGPIGQGPYLNQMVAVQTSLAPHELLKRLLDIEQLEGRTRGVRWGPRTIDLDIVCFDHQAVHDPNLRVPHPELSNRGFWQRELAELRGTQ